MGCLFPINLKNPRFGKTKGAFQYIPGRCGKCANCLRERANNWVFKLTQEYNSSNTRSCYFCTFTYNPEAMNEPGSGRITENGFQTLVKRDFQLFMKRLRKVYQKQKDIIIKYFAVGEYGFYEERPHFHAIIFNADQLAIENAWKHGFSLVEVPRCAEASMSYTAKYMTKGKVIPRFEEDDRLPEFHLFSQGLGLSYITPAMVKWHNADPYNRNFVPMPGGFKMAMPYSHRIRIFPKYILDKMLDRVSSEWTKQEAQREQDYLRNHSTLDNFYKDRNESRIQSHETFVKRARERRK